MATDSNETMIFDFHCKEHIANWRSIDDRIMGGCSQSQSMLVEGAGMRFCGTVSIENNGGFASIRSSSNQHDLSRHRGLLICLRGDGKTYKLSLRTDNYFDGVSYQARFSTQAGAWREVALPFDQFRPTHHGIELTTVAPLDPSQVQSFGLFIADRQAGPFQLDIAWIKAV